MAHCLSQGRIFNCLCHLSIRNDKKCIYFSCFLKLIKSDEEWYYLLLTFLKYNHELYVVALVPTGIHPSSNCLSSLYSRVCYGPPGPYFIVISHMAPILSWRQKCELLVGMMNASPETHQHTLHMVCWRTHRSLWIDDGLGGLTGINIVCLTGLWLC